MSNVEINFHVVGAGWADLELNFADCSFVAKSISYTTDTIGDLLRAALLIATGAPSATVSFDREPTEWRLIFDSLLDSVSGQGPVQLRLLEFADYYAAQPDTEGHEVFKVSCSALDFSRAVLRTANSAKDTDFVTEFGRDSEAAYQALKAALEVYTGRTSNPLNS